MSDSSRHSMPSWVWLFTGVATGLFLAFLYYLAGVQTPKTTPAQRDTSQPTQKSTQAPTFDFYNLLPDVEVKSPKNSTPQDTATSQVDNKPSIADLVLQTGAFSNPADADKRRAELLLLGLDVAVSTATIKDRTYHRVQVGPFSSEQALHNAKKLLAQNNIEHIQRKVAKRN